MILLVLSLFSVSYYLVLNPEEIIGHCGVFIVRDFRTVFKERRPSCYVDVLLNYSYY